MLARRDGITYLLKFETNSNDSPVLFLCDVVTR
jgi:hypothetical protein